MRQASKTSNTFTSVLLVRQATLLTGFYMMATLAFNELREVFPTGLGERFYPYTDNASANRLKLKRQFLGNPVFTEIYLYCNIIYHLIISQYITLHYITIY